MMIFWNAIFSDVVRKNYKPRSPILKAKFSETGPETYLETCTEIKDYNIEIGKCDKMLYLLNNQAMLQVSWNPASMYHPFDKETDTRPELESMKL